MALADAAHGARAPKRAHLHADGDEAPGPKAKGAFPGDETLGRLASFLQTNIAERWLRRAVPAFVLLLLAGIMALHSLLLLNDRTAAQRQSAETLETAGQLVALRLALHPDGRIERE